MTITVLYFAWLREGIGQSCEQVQSTAKTPRQLIEELRKRGPAYAHALRDCKAFRVSINHVLAEFDDAIPTDAEVAFFPPMTGG